MSLPFTFIKAAPRCFLRFASNHTLASSRPRPVLSPSFFSKTVARPPGPSLVIRRLLHQRRSNKFQRPSSNILDRIPQGFVFWGIVGLNGLVYMMWQSAKTREQLIFMVENFSATWANTFQRPWTLITAAFSHQEPFHILGNAITFYFFGRPVLELLGNKRFLGLYLAAAGISSLAAAAFGGSNRYTIGASGAVFSVVTFLGCVAPKTIFFIYFIPVPAYLAVPGLFAWDLYHSLNLKTDDHTSRAGHVAGIATGVAYFVARRYGIFY